MHYHTFFVYERDPLTGMPIALVAIPGTPASAPGSRGPRTPKRSICYSVRPKLAWLETALHLPSTPKAIVPPPLSIGHDA